MSNESDMESDEPPEPPVSIGYESTSKEEKMGDDEPESGYVMAPTDNNPNRGADEELIPISDARELAERAWVERSSRERGDVELTEFQKRAARTQFNNWWNIEVDL